MIRNTVLAFFLSPAVVVSALTQASNAFAESKFDGSWSVAAYTTTGSCDPSYRFSGQIVNGDISYAYGSLEVTGRVEANGNTIVRITAGTGHGEAHGRMTLTHGGGTWSGVGPDGHCAGTWEARRK
jgi:outer membrane lipoprotein-sorting protein